MSLTLTFQSSVAHSRATGERARMTHVHACAFVRTEMCGRALRAYMVIGAVPGSQEPVPGCPGQTLVKPPPHSRLGNDRHTDTQDTALYTLTHTPST
mgnify:CR=1 FL=1